MYVCMYNAVDHGLWFVDNVAYARQTLHRRGLHTACLHPSSVSGFVGVLTKNFNLAVNCL